MKIPVNIPAALVSGAVGAVSVTLMHECTRKTMPHPPRADVIGMKAVAALARRAGTEPPEHLRTTALIGDLISNSFYYSSVAAGGPDNAVVNGAVAGMAAGVGLLLLPEPLGLGGAEVNRTVGTQIMGAGMYLAAGLIAGLTYRAIAGRKAAAYSR